MAKKLDITDVTINGMPHFVRRVTDLVPFATVEGVEYVAIPKEVPGEKMDKRRRRTTTHAPHMGDDMLVRSIARVLTEVPNAQRTYSDVCKKVPASVDRVKSVLLRWSKDGRIKYTGSQKGERIQILDLRWLLKEASLNAIAETAAQAGANARELEARQGSAKRGRGITIGHNHVSK